MLHFKIALSFTLSTAILFAIITTATSSSSSPSSSSSSIAATVATSSANVSKLSSVAIGHSADMSLMQFMTPSRATTQRSPQRSLACFDYYVPVLNQIATDFENQYGACLQNAEMAREDLNGATQTERTEIEERVDTSCASMANCNRLQEAEAHFECYVNVALNNTKIMYAISAYASKKLLDQREKLVAIDHDQFVCSNDSKREYKEKAASLYEDLRNCLSPVTTTITTTAAATITTTAAATITTTTATTTTATQSITTDSTEIVETTLSINR